jgi:hypothetical protein
VALTIEATSSSEMPVDFLRSTRSYIPEERTLLTRYSENFESCALEETAVLYLEPPTIDSIFGATIFTFTRHVRG